MTHYDDRGSGEIPPADIEVPSGPRLPGGISMQTAAAVLLIVAVVAVLWLLASPEGEAPPVAGTPVGTAVRAALTGTGTARASGTVVTLPGAVGTPVSGAAIATGAAGTAVAVVGSPVAAIGTPGVAVAGATAGSVASGGIAQGGFVTITGSGTDGIRFRFGPGLNYATIRIATDGDTMMVVGGPESGDGYTWWRLQDSLGNIGWAAESFLAGAAAPGLWSPPSASPTFEAGSDIELLPTDEPTAVSP